MVVQRFPRATLHGRVLAAALVLSVFTSCGSYQLLEVQDSDFLYFGTARPGGVVSDVEWKSFVDEVITPRFPGFTEWTAEGHWKEQRELTHVVQIVHPHRGGAERAVAEIIAAYKKRFDQESVYWVQSPALARPR